MDPIGTCQALDLLTQDQLEQLFDDKTGYLSKVDETFDAARKNDNKLANIINQMNKEAVQKNDNTNTTDDSELQSEVYEIRNNSHRRHSSIFTDKKCLVLDVDNTLIYVRHFMDEMRVEDEVRLGDENARITKITFRLDLEFTESGQISVYEHTLTSKLDFIPQRGDWFPDENTKVALIHQSDPISCELELLDQYTTDEDVDDDDEENEEEVDSFDINEDNQIFSKEHPQNTASLELESVSNDSNKNESENNVKKEILSNKNTNDIINKSSQKHRTLNISFLQNSNELSMLEPMMTRTDMIDVTFMYGGYLVRIRPGLGEFLCRCNEKYDVILFTAADGSVYDGLLKQVHCILIKQLLERKVAMPSLNFAVPNELWDKIYFRVDCDEKIDEHGLPFRHKNLAKLGRELSTIVMVDDNPLSYRGFEPNCVRLAAFWGANTPIDNELLSTLYPILCTAAAHTDVRYHLTGLGQPPSDMEYDSNINNNTHRKSVINKNDINYIGIQKNDEQNGSETEDLFDRQRRHSRRKSVKFMEHLRDALIADTDDDTSLTTIDDEDKNIHKPNVDSGSDVEVSDLDSISSKEMQMVKERERKLSMKSNADQNAMIDNPFDDNFNGNVKHKKKVSINCASNKHEYISSSSSKTTTVEMEVVIPVLHHARQISSSGIGDQGFVVYNQLNVDNDEYLREVDEQQFYETEQSNISNHTHSTLHDDRRPSIELQYANNINHNNNSQQAGDGYPSFVAANMQPNANKTSDNSYQAMIIPTSTSDAKESGMDMSPLSNTSENNEDIETPKVGNVQFDDDDDYYVNDDKNEVYSSCSCFSWLTKKKTNKMRTPTSQSNTLR